LIINKYKKISINAKKDSARGGNRAEPFQDREGGGTKALVFHLG